MSLTTFPLVYCPHGVAKPACCPHPGGMALLSTAATLPGQHGGTCWGGQFNASLPWRATPAGWFIALGDRLPQHLARLRSHPRLARWLVVDGIDTGHWWRVPVLIAPDPQQPECFVSALDRVWNGTGWTAADDELDRLAAQVLSVATGIQLAATPADRDAACTRLAIELLTLGQHIDGDLLAAAGWLSESLVIRVLRAAFGMGDGSP